MVHDFNVGAVVISIVVFTSNLRVVPREGYTCYGPAEKSQRAATSWRQNDRFATQFSPSWGPLISTSSSLISTDKSLEEALAVARFITRKIIRFPPYMTKASIPRHPCACAALTYGVNRYGFYGKAKFVCWNSGVKYHRHRTVAFYVCGAKTVDDERADSCLDVIVTCGTMDDVPDPGKV